MTLEERLRRYDEKGELVHLSLAFHDGKFHAQLALASPPNGYSSAEDQDPVTALEKVFEKAPVKLRRPPAREGRAREEITAAVTEKEPAPMPADWTTP